MNRDDLIAALVDHRLATKRNVTNPTRLRELIRGDLEQLTDNELQADYNHVTGATKRPSSDAIDYRVTTLDHAISLALICLERGFTTADTQAIMLDDYPASIAGRALSAATDGAYTIHLGTHHHAQPDLATSKPMSLADYLATHPGPQTTRPTVEEPAA